MDVICGIIVPQKNILTFTLHESKSGLQQDTYNGSEWTNPKKYYKTQFK